jgi:DUF4097 and DUF4098 domain-containing protein YvlB
LHTVQTTTPLGEFTRVVVSSDVGSVQVQSGRTWSVRTVQHWNLLAPKVTQGVSGGVLTVTSRCPQLQLSLNECSVDLLLTVPVAVSLKATLGAGDLTTSRLSGNQELRAGAGDVTLSDIQGAAITASTGAGDVIAQRISAGSFAGRSSAGEVRAELVSVGSLASVTSGAGDVRLVVPKGGYDVKTRTGSGDVTVRGVTKAPGSAHHLVATSSAGDVEIDGR